MDHIEKHIRITNIAIGLCETPEFRDIFLDLASRKNFVDPFEWHDEEHLKGSMWRPKELVHFFKKINSQCPGLVEFKQQGGLKRLLGFPQIRITDEGQKLAEMLRESKKKIGK